MGHKQDTTTGVLVTIYWSGMGKPATRKSTWTRQVRAKWPDAKRVVEGTWILPDAAKLTHVEAIFAAGALLGSDKAIVCFPHGHRARGTNASQMSVHYYNCHPE